MLTLRKSTQFILSFALITLLSACGSMGVKIVGPALTNAEVKKLIEGNTVQGPLGTAMYDWYYQADGSVTGVVGVSDDDSGKWSMQGSNTYCHRWDEYFEGVQHCYEWYKQERSGRYVMKNVDADRGENIEVWAIVEGNPYNM